MLNEPSGISDIVPVRNVVRPADDLRSKLRAAVDEVFFVEAESAELPKPITASYTGRMLMDSLTAYDHLDKLFKALDHVPVFLNEGTRHTIRAVRGRFNPPPRPWWPNAVLLVLTILSLLFIGSITELGRLPAPLELIRGWPYALGLLSILGAHELGHYFMARHL
jgi:hypothetical protein